LKLARSEFALVAPLNYQRFMNTASLSKGISAQRLPKLAWIGFLFVALGHINGIAFAAKARFDVTQSPFGAVADGKTDNAKAIQAAIQAAEHAGGGDVVFPAAEQSYLSGPFQLRSHVHLVIEKGALLQMLPYHAYPGTEDFITATKAEDVAITGAGRIDGQGRPWWEAYDNTPKSDTSRKTMRPKRMIAFESCVKSVIRDVTLTNPPNVHIALNGKCRDIVISGIHIDSPEKSHNTDGIDMSGEHIRIENCSISCGDDNIAIGGSGSDDVKVTGCKFGVGHGMSIGSHTVGGVKKLLVSNCTFDGTHTGIRLKSERDRGGLVENLTYADLTMTGVAIPIHISSYYGEKEPKKFDADQAQPVTKTTPHWRNITIRNVTATGAKEAGILWALPESPIENLTLEHVSIEAGKGMKAVHIKGFKTDDVKIMVDGRDKPITRFHVE